MGSHGAGAGGVDTWDLARRLDATFPPLDDHGRRVAVATYRALARGEPATSEAIAEYAGVHAAEVREVMAPWPGVYRDESERVVGFWGLALQEMDHALVIDGVRLYAWCAWDTLFIPGVLGRPAEVRSRSGMSREPIRLAVTRGAAVADPPSTAVSFLDPSAGDIDTDRIVSSFCHHILFFATQEEGETWAAGVDLAPLVLGVEEAFYLGRAFNRVRFGLR